MLVSVVIRTKNEADRLRLVLASLSRQTVLLGTAASLEGTSPLDLEIVVVDDGSTDHTAEVLRAEIDHLPLRTVRLAPSRGRAEASNAGARQARGELLLFMDGDVLAAPDLVERHARAHEGRTVLARGETYHLRCTRFFLNPETGSPRPGAEADVDRMGAQRSANLVTRAQVLREFATIEARAQPGIYPGAGPRRLYEVEYETLHQHPQLEVLWMAASGHNLSVRRSVFADVGGFRGALEHNDHRELALRLQRRGVRLVPVANARSYHLTHQVGWRDPLADRTWEQEFYRLHPSMAVKLMSVFWLSLTEDRGIPAAARIRSLVELDAMVRKEGAAVDYDAVRLAHPRLGPLGDA